MPRPIEIGQIQRGRIQSGWIQSGETGNEPSMAQSVGCDPAWPDLEWNRNVRLVETLEDVSESDRGGALSIGNFDGVHQGHAKLLRQLVAMAKRLEGPAVVLTFDPHPVRLLRPAETPPPLTWTRRKADLMADLGVDTVVAYPTDHELLQMTPEEFFNHMVKETFSAKGLVEGPNFYFGRDRAGDVARLRELCDSNQCELEIVQPTLESDSYISSSRIRQLIGDGDVDTVRHWLTQPYRLRGMVVHGASRGRSIGFPTANLDAVETLIPAFGVYGGYAMDRTGKRFPAAIHIGPNPTFAEARPKLEVHLIGFEGSLYGEPLEVDFWFRIRGIVQFTSVDELADQLRQDVAEVQQRLADR